MIVIDVLGSPAPKGNARAFVSKATGRAILSSFGSGQREKRLRSWDANVRDQAMLVCGDRQSPVFCGEPLSVGIVFRIARPQGHWGKGKRAGQLLPSAPIAPVGKPDSDKLARSTLDALHGSVFDDDSRIVELIVIKQYASPGREGARIVVRRWQPAEGSVTHG